MLRIWNHVVSKEIVKEKVHNTLNTEVNNLDNNSWCYYSDSHKSTQRRYIKFEEKFGDADKIIPDVSGLVTTTVSSTKISDVEYKIVQL